MGKWRSSHARAATDPATADPSEVYVWYRDADAAPLGRVMLMSGPFRQPILFAFATPTLADDLRSRHDFGSVTLRTLAEVRAAEGNAFPEARGLFVFTAVEQIRLWQRDKRRFIASIADQIRAIPP